MYMNKTYSRTRCNCMWLDFGMLTESSLVIFNYCIVWCLGEIKCILSSTNYSLFYFISDIMWEEKPCLTVTLKVVCISPFHTLIVAVLHVVNISLFIQCISYMYHMFLFFWNCLIIKLCYQVWITSLSKICKNGLA